jgi:hypothetical protein
MNRIPNTQLESFKQYLNENPQSKEEMVHSAIDHLGGEATTFEVAELLRWSVHCVCGKITVLQDKGRVADTGKTKTHKTLNASREVAIWKTGVFEPRKKMSKREMIALISKLQFENNELRQQLQATKFEKAERFVCQRCQGKGYIEEEQATFDL